MKDDGDGRARVRPDEVGPRFDRFQRRGLSAVTLRVSLLCQANLASCGFRLVRRRIGAVALMVGRFGVAVLDSGDRVVVGRVVVCAGSVMR